MPDKTSFQIQQAGNDENFTGTVIEMLDPKEVDRLLAHLQDLQESKTAD